MKKQAFYLAFFATVLTILISVGTFIYRAETRVEQRRYDSFVDSVRQGSVTAVEMVGGRITYRLSGGERFQTYAPSPDLVVGLLDEHQVALTARDDTVSPLWNLVTVTLPILLVLLVYVVLASKRNGEREPESSDFTRRRVAGLGGQSRVSFDDIAGIPEVLEEVREIVALLKNPDRFSRLGGVIPKGVLLQGPPGTGKTLLARAIAGEASAPFYYFSGSDFVEMFVGVGASRVRDLFSEAKKKTPCIVFIDEIDAVGAHRSSGAGLGGQEERSQTLNALLVEMDGFARDETVIVLAATNRPDILDPALLRPGRFDRVITILAPDVKGRRQILEVHARKITMNEVVDLEAVAKATPGFTGAELANLVNEAALIAARKGHKAVGEEDFVEARDRIVIGVERKGFVLSQDDKRTIAYHEAGHAILARFLPHADPIRKITIIPRGKAMGHTQQTPLSDRHAYTREYLRARVTVLLGGRAAEQLCLNQQSTGSEDDLLRATEIATRMVCQWGMNEVLGPVAYVRPGEGFLGGGERLMIHSERTGQHIDAEVRALMESCSQDALQVLRQHRAFLEQFADILLQTETLDEEEMRIIFECSQKLKRQEADGQSDRDEEQQSCGMVAVKESVATTM